MVLPPGHFPMIIISFKALSVVSLRRPTVAFLLKPFLWCRSDARLWYLLFCIFRSRSLSDTRLAPVFIILHFPLEESFRHSFGTSIYYSAVSARGVIQTLVWHPVFITS